MNELELRYHKVQHRPVLRGAVLAYALEANAHMIVEKKSSSVVMVCEERDEALTIEHQEQGLVGILVFSQFPGSLYVNFTWVDKDMRGNGVNALFLPRLHGIAKRRGLQYIERRVHVSNARWWPRLLSDGYKIHGRPKRGVLELRKTL